MAMQEATGFCKACKKQVAIRRPGTNHLLHLFLTLCTLGLWSIVWVFVSIKIGGWRCSQCGQRCSRSLMR